MSKSSMAFEPTFESVFAETEIRLRHQLKKSKSLHDKDLNDEMGLFSLILRLQARPPVVDEVFWTKKNSVKKKFSELVNSGYLCLDKDLVSIPPSLVESLASEIKSNHRNGVKDRYSLMMRYLLKSIITPTILDICKLYLQVKRPWIYTPSIMVYEAKKEYLSELERSQNAFAFHRDYDNLRWIKLFVSLSESAINSAHQYILGSHFYNWTSHELTSPSFFREKEEAANRQGLFHSAIDVSDRLLTHMRLGRISEASVLKTYGPKSLLTIPLKQGACWLEDSYGLHRGLPSHDGTRVLVSTTIGSHPFRYK